MGQGSEGDLRMGNELVVLLVSFTALTFVVFYVGRVFTFFLKIFLAAAIAFFILHQVNFKKWDICQAKSQAPVLVTNALCR